MIQKVIKKDGRVIPFDGNKIIKAIEKSSRRIGEHLTHKQIQEVVDTVRNHTHKEAVKVSSIHNYVELALDKVNSKVASAYRDYRNYKTSFASILDKVYQKAESLQYLGDVDNANTDSSLVSTQRSLVYNELNSELYKKFFLSPEETEAMDKGYIYIHDRSARRDTMNCCLFDVANVLKGGFEMGNVWYNEPSTLDTAFDVISDLALSSAAMQYGGWTAPRVDEVLAPYARKSYNIYVDEYLKIIEGSREDKTTLTKADAWAMKKVQRDFEQGFQGWEYKFNTVGSSRGDYPFIAISFGNGGCKFCSMATSAILKVRKGGQGKKGFKRPVLFPKLTFLYDEEMHGIGKTYEYLFNEAIDCSSKCMYPDYLSLSGEGYIPSVYKRYGEVVSLMGCRASLSSWYRRGGMYPVDEQDTPVFEGRFNLGAITLHLPMIYMKAQRENKPFLKELDYYLELVRTLHKKTYEYLAEKKASTNPLGYMQGGFLGGNLKANDTIRSVLPAMTMSFGITALNELEQLHNKQSVIENGSFSLMVMEYINMRVNSFKQSDNILYAIYGTPGETLCGLQMRQLVEEFGEVDGITNRGYVSNSFHCGVWEDISPIQKQDYEKRFWDLFDGGKIQYVRFNLNYNIEAMKTLVRRGMQLGFYQGVNLNLAYCEECGYEEIDMKVCSKCGNDRITEINRMNGYLLYSRIQGGTRTNKTKLEEINDRKSM